MKRLLALILAVTLIAGMPVVFAQREYSVSVKTDYSTDVTTVEGDFGSAFSYRRVNIIVLNPGYTADDLGISPLALNWSAQAVLDDEGKFSTTMNLIPSQTSEGTVYTVLVAVDKSGEIIERTFEMYNEKYILNVIKEIKDAVADKDPDAIGDIINNHIVILDIESTDEYAVYSDMDGDRAERVRKGIIMEKANSVESFYTAFLQSVAAVELDFIQDEDEYAKAFLPLVENAPDSVKSQVKAAFEGENTELVSDIMAEEFNSPAHIEERLYDLIVLKEINNSKIWSEIAAVYLKYSDVLDIDTKAYEKLDSKKKAMSNLLDKDFDTIEEASEAFDEAVEKQADKEKDSSGSSGSSGGGGGRGGVSIGGGQNTPVAPIVPGTEPEKSEAKIEFSDLEGFEWAKENIVALASKGIINGYDANTFAPGNKITRAEFVKLFVSAFDIKAEGETGFDDVDKNQWYYESVKAAYCAGYVNGVSADSFAPGEYITRQDIAVILHRYLKNTAGSDISFADENEISGYAADAVKALSGSKIINGYEDGTFRPKNNATRAEVATVIARILKEKGEI